MFDLIIFIIAFMYILFMLMEKEESDDVMMVTMPFIWSFPHPNIKHQPFFFALIQTNLPLGHSQSRGSQTAQKPAFVSELQV